MIQVCSRCGTRWNVRDRQREWCPRCQGALLAPSGYAPASEWSPRSVTPGPGPQGAPPRLPAGYRWIAVRPGAPPPPRARRRPLGPTPRYSSVPRWGLVEHFETRHDAAPQAYRGPSGAVARATLTVTMGVLGATALIHAVRYALLLVNRTVLLNPYLAGAATWLAVALSVLSLFLVVGSIIVLTNWLIARRGAAYAYHGQTDPRGVWQLRLGCLIPLANLVFAPVFVIELAALEHKSSILRRPITVWWIVWVLSTILSIFSIATSFATDAQGIADNTVTTTVAYLTALAALLLTHQVLAGFERTPVSRPVKRWVMVPDDSRSAAAPARPADPESARPVESDGQNPAA
ncbi:DUF4328 domain-containing protein [Mycolicibacterium sp. S2-37]|uniref:DUF4328 domain-containing protein n=1 Tax=Mycolicibacterium sp. S2-37 TaxID=2810297 RepID=UPI001A9508A7|nr:DUF4328 domain-containing protein [Mycolicibacterium sp. S2-37]MBO0679806.1 DUF4328 domain-containing protein [Mycolicibacterium sp. S2-37]MBO0681203.1 DUF4328 domain-containing protein [Mycolicibacterium sp. S2-37]